MIRLDVARRRLATLAALGVIVASCGGASENLAIVGSSPSTIGTGEQRLVMIEVGADDRVVGGPGDEATATFEGPDGQTQTVTLDWVWSIPDARGFYIARPTFDEPGQWNVAISSPDRGTTGRFPFTVNADVPLPEVGEAAPRSETRTIPESDLSEITTDPDPRPALYEMTVAEAVTNGTPALIAFATPAFCQTAVCGPTLDIVKEVTDLRSGFDAVHVEVFENIESDGAGQLVEVPAVIEWGLPSEPWIFVVDADGVVTARFEGAVSADELIEALDTTG